MTTFKRNPSRRSRVTVFRNHPEIDQETIAGIYVEAMEEVAVLDKLREMGGRKSTAQLARRIPMMTKPEIEAALQRQRSVGNVVMFWERSRFVWELV